MVLPTLNYFHSSRHQSQPNNEGDVIIFLSPSPEKNLYDLGSDEDEDDLTDMNPEEMELAYVALWEKTAIAASSAGELWGGCVIPEPAVAEAKDKKEDRGKKSKPTYGWANHRPTLPPAN